MDTTQQIPVRDKIDAFFGSFPRREYPKGQIVIFAHESPDHIFYIAKGRVRKYSTSYKGDEVIVNTFQPPAFFPMSWALNRSPNEYFYKTEEPTVLHIVPAEDTVMFLKENPDVTLDLIARLYRGLDGFLGRVVHLMSGTAKSRLMYELIIECRRFGVPQDGGCMLLKSNELDIAARSGLTRETVSREMNKLKHKQLVQVSPKGIMVTNLKGLEDLIGGEI